MLRWACLNTLSTILRSVAVGKTFHIDSWAGGGIQPLKLCTNWYTMSKGGYGVSNWTVGSCLMGAICASMIAITTCASPDKKPRLKPGEPKLSEPRRREGERRLRPDELGQKESEPTLKPRPGK